MPPRFLRIFRPCTGPLVWTPFVAGAGVHRIDTVRTYGHFKGRGLLVMCGGDFNHEYMLNKRLKPLVVVHNPQDIRERSLKYPSSEPLKMPI